VTIDGHLAGVATDRAGMTVDRPYSSSWDPRDRTLHVHGAVDELCVSTFRDDLLAHVEVSGGATVDLTDVDLFPSVAVSALVAGMKRATGNGGTLDVLVRAGGVTQRVLAICALPHRVVAAGA
jgi:anti-anti-sigma regulatory factor